MQHRCCLNVHCLPQINVLNIPMRRECACHRVKPVRLAWSATLVTIPVEWCMHIHGYVFKNSHILLALAYYLPPVAAPTIARHQDVNCLRRVSGIPNSTIHYFLH